MGKVVVVDEKDTVIGKVDIEEAVKKSLIRRIATVVLYNDKGQILLQKRSKNKKSYPGCWVSAASGHVEENESYEDAAYRELKEELSIENIKLNKLDYFFISPEEDLNKLPKYTTVFIGKCNEKKFDFNKWEVEQVKWFDFSQILEKINKSPLEFTPTFIKLIKRTEHELMNLSSN